MRIKKIAPVTPANGNIENSYGTSQTDTYSQEYLNEFIEDSGWQTPTIGSDFNIGGSFKYRKIGSIVFVNLTVSAKNNIALKDALNVIATGLPAPDTDIELATYIATGNLTFRTCLRTTGDLQLWWNTTGTLQANKNFTITFTYMV